ncbi:MAG: helix-turn-helix domain-containing protein [Anaerolineae bacterium]|nr:helix-turn-helix domain-containing protein [Anaerolineae bacterium]
MEADASPFPVRVTTAGQSRLPVGAALFAFLGVYTVFGDLSNTTSCNSTQQNKTFYNKRERRMTEPEVLTVEQVAEYLQMPVQTVRQHLRNRELPGRKVGKTWRVLRSELEAWLRQPEAGGDEDAAPEWRPRITPRPSLPTTNQPPST